MFADYHLHTWYSDDSDYPMEQLVRDAIAAGLAEIQRLRERYSGHITIREGMEFGMQVHTIPYNETAVSSIIKR